MAVVTSQSFMAQSLAPSQTNDRSAAESYNSRRDNHEVLNMLSDRPLLELGEAVYPQFCRSQERRATFATWPLTQYFPPEDLVSQGFYYAGYADCIRCFYCGVGLKSWAEGDNVMEEHIRWRPSCGYLLNTKGRRFVNTVQSHLQGERSGDDSNSTPAQTAAAPTTGDEGGGGGGGGNGGMEVVRQLEEMGYHRDSVTRAVQHLQQAGLTTDVDSIIDTITQLQARDTTPNTGGSGNNSEQTTGTANGTEVGNTENTQDPEDQLRAENERLRSLQTCRQCRSARVNLLFLPCGHLLTCAACGTQCTHCLKCGRFINATTNVYLT